MKHIVAIPTWRCNLSCDYCDYQVVDGCAKLFYKDKPCVSVPADGASAEEWLEFLAPHAPYHFELTGGEPTLYKELPELITNLHQGCTWGMTTNLTRFDFFSPRTGVHNCRGITASYHPTARYPYGNLAYFLNYIGRLKGRGYETSVTIVVTPDNMDILGDWIEATEQWTSVNLNLYATKGYAWEPEALSKTDAFKEQFFACRHTAWPDNRAEGKECVAGDDYFVVGPDLTVYPCYSLMVEPNPVAINGTCYNNCAFPCDYDYGRVKWPARN